MNRKKIILAAALAVLVATVVALYPYLGDMGMCDSAECPYATQSSSHTSSSGLASVCVGAVMSASAVPALLAFATLRARRLSDERSRPAQFFLSPDPPPPQLS